VGFRAGLDRCRKSRPHRDSISGPSNLVCYKSAKIYEKLTASIFDPEVGDSWFFRNILNFYQTSPDMALHSSTDPASKLISYHHICNSDGTAQLGKSHRITCH